MGCEQAAHNPRSHLRLAAPTGCGTNHAPAHLAHRTQGVLPQPTHPQLTAPPRAQAGHAHNPRSHPQLARPPSPAHARTQAQTGRAHSHPTSRSHPSPPHAHTQARASRPPQPSPPHTCGRRHAHHPSPAPQTPGPGQASAHPTHTRGDASSHAAPGPDGADRNSPNRAAHPRPTHQAARTLGSQTGTTRPSRAQDPPSTVRRSGRPRRLPPHSQPLPPVSAGQPSIPPPTADQPAPAALRPAPTQQRALSPQRPPTTGTVR